jgi:hypothetical protein
MTSRRAARLSFRSAPDNKARRIGTALLVVDGTDEVPNRKAEISLTPGRTMARSLSKLVSLSREHGDVNATQVIAARGEQADTIWVASVSPQLTRPIPRNRGRKVEVADQKGAGSAPHARVA